MDVTLTRTALLVFKVIFEARFLGNDTSAFCGSFVILYPFCEVLMKTFHDFISTTSSLC